MDVWYGSGLAVADNLPGFWMSSGGLGRVWQRASNATSGSLASHRDEGAPQVIWCGAVLGLLPATRHGLGRISFQ